LDKDTKLRYLIGFVVVAAIIAGAAYKNLTQLPDCKDNPSAKVIILIDQTDPVTSLQNDELKKRALSFLGNKKLKDGRLISDSSIDTPVNSLVTLFYISSNQKELKPLFSECRPPSEREVNSIEGDPKTAQRFYVKKFESPLSEFLKVGSQKENASPIAETLNSISRTAYFSGLGKGKPKTKILIFSDMIQHTEDISLYGCSSNPALTTAGKNLISKLSNSYSGADIYIHQIIRTKSDSQQLPSSQCIKQFWSNALGGSTVIEEL